jgi:hypothetical protein
MLRTVRVTVIPVTGFKSQPFGRNLVLAPAPPGSPRCPPLRNVTGRRGRSPVRGPAPYTSRSISSGHIFSNRARLGRRAPECGRYVSGDDHAWAGLQRGAGRPEEATPVRVQRPVHSRPIARLPAAPLRASKSPSHYTPDVTCPDVVRRDAGPTVDSRQVHADAYMHRCGHAVPSRQ